MITAHPKNQLTCHSYAYKDEGYSVHMFTSGKRSFFTNAYIIETENALVVIDTMMINSDAKLLRQHLDNLNKPLIAVIITHGHPDHYNGTNVITTGFSNVSVISTQGVYDCIEQTVDAKEIKWKPFFGSDWPKHKPLPNTFVKDDETVCLDGLNYHFKDLGAAESSSDLLFTLGANRSVVFVGDIVFNKMHGFMNDGNSRRWLTVLQQLLTDLSDVETLFTGHGAPGNAYQLIKQQIDYIAYYQSSLLSIIDDSHFLTDAQKHSFEKIMIDKYPEYSLTPFITAGMEPVAKELRLTQASIKTPQQEAIQDSGSIR